MKNTFGKPIIPENDKQRLAALDKLHLLDAPEEESLNEIASVVARIFNVPIALISMVAKEEVIFKGRFGFDHERSSRGVSLCALAVLDDDVTLFEDAKEEPCLMANPLVQGDFGLRFYAGAPLRTLDGFNVGTLCIVDKKQRFFSSDQTKLLRDFATIVMHMINLRTLALKNKSAALIY